MTSDELVQALLEYLPETADEAFASALSSPEWTRRHGREGIDPRTASAILANFTLEDALAEAALADMWDRLDALTA